MSDVAADFLQDAGGRWWLLQVTALGVAAAGRGTGGRVRGTMAESEAGFEARLAALPFRWPLKPYGTAASPSNVKTVAINKNAETAVYMREIVINQRRELAST